ncbi:unnamed protein product [Meganyctiphanes norvegica]|uniref:Uncharacterized protein n=1 Tax=Meganyctiphanes norvegica TaxID=48144 RepID=A0AAV2SCL2_MEGNR
MSGTPYVRYAFVSAYVPSGPSHFYRYRSGSTPRETSVTDKRLTIEGKRSSNIHTMSCSSSTSSSSSYDRFSTGGVDQTYRASSLQPGRYWGRHLGGRMEPSIRITGRAH